MKNNRGKTSGVEGEPQRELVQVRTSFPNPTFQTLWPWARRDAAKSVCLAQKWIDWRAREGDLAGVLDPLQAAGWERRGSREASAQLTASLALHYALRCTLVIYYTTEGSPFTRLAWCIPETPLDRGRDGVKLKILCTTKSLYCNLERKGNVRE